MSGLLALLCVVTQIYYYVLIAYIVLQYVPRPPEPILPLIRGVGMLVDPLLRPLRGVIPSVPVGSVRFDLSILVLFVVNGLLSAAVC